MWFCCASVLQVTVLERRLVGSIGKVGPRFKEPRWQLIVPLDRYPRIRVKERGHECKPSPHRHTSASTSGEKAAQTARADCGSPDDRTGCARSKGAANLFRI